MTWRPWKRKPSDRASNGKLLIPLPIPHPVHIAIAIHNRDTEQPIPLDSELCWDILRAIEECQGDVGVSERFLIDCPTQLNNIPFRLQILYQDIAAELLNRVSIR